MELYNGKICATYDDLVGILSTRSVQHGVQRGKICQMRRACIGTPALFEIASLPYKCRVELHRRNPDLQQQTASREFVELVEPDGHAAAFYDNYRIDAIRGLDFAKQEEYTNNASILVMFRAMIDRANSKRSAVSKPRLNLTDFWNRAAQALPRLADKYPHSLPAHPRRLQAKCNEFFRGGVAHYEVLVSGKFRNSNASKIAAAEQEELLIKLLSDHRNFDNKQVAMFYNIFAQKLDWPTITAAAIRSWRARHELTAAAGRLGEKELLNNRLMQVRRAAPKLPMTMWSLDGWVCELLFQERRDKVTTYHNRLVVEVVLDPCTKYPIGYAVGRQEDTSLIKEALRNAANHTAELFGRRYRAHQIQSDRFAMKAMTPVYQAVGAEFTPAKVGNAKSKPIERYFGTLNKRYAQLFDNWSGFGITSDKSRQPNADAIDKLKKNFPDQDGCRRQIDFIIQTERARCREQYLALWAQTPEERRLPLSDEQYLLTFGEQTGCKNALEGSGLHIKLLGERHTYDCFDVNFRRYAHIRWNVKYDPANLDRVLALSDDGSLRFLLESKYIQPMAKIDRTQEDQAQLARIAQYNDQITRQVSQQIAAASQTTERIVRENPQLNDTLARLLISDSQGQHKNRLQAQRQRSINVQAIEVIPIDSSPAPVPTPCATRSLY